MLENLFPLIKHKINKIIILLLVFIIFASPRPIYAQSDEQVYIVQPGDTLNVIALRFGISSDDIINANQIEDPNLLSEGMRLVIPGLKIGPGILSTETVPLGTSFQTLSRQYQVPQDLLAQINRLTTPSEFFAGSNIIIPIDAANVLPQNRFNLPDNTTFLEFTLAQNVNPWTINLVNGINFDTNSIPGETLFTFETNENPTSAYVSQFIKSIEIDALPLVQGNTEIIKITTTEPIQFSGQLAGKPLSFFSETENSYYAIQGIHAMADTGLADFNLVGVTSSGSTVRFNQLVLLQSGFYPSDPSLGVDPATIDSAITKPEDDLVLSYTSQITPIKYWNGPFQLPVDEPYCIKSYFGNRRDYNNGALLSFHGGVDFGVCATLNIYSPADGTVVFSGPLTVRGNATIIDHGQGIFSGIWHQAESYAQAGDQVKQGDLIGIIGATGRVTGPHLHWEIWANGVQINPLPWLENSYP